VSEIPELDIRKEVAETFLSTQAGRDWWVRARLFHVDERARPARQRVAKIMDEELRRILTSHGTEPIRQDGRRAADG
jgi:hypothetical protein